MINFDETAIKFKDFEYKKSLYRKPITLPLVERIMAQTLAEELVSVQPMTHPTTTMSLQPPTPEYIPGHRTIYNRTTEDNNREAFLQQLERDASKMRRLMRKL